MADRKLIVGIVVSLLLGSLAGCRNGSATHSKEEKPIPAGEIRLLFSYGSEKQKWVDDVTAAFNQSGAKTSSGKRITVKAVPKGSGECIDDLITGREHADLTSPASNVFIKQGNAQSRTIQVRI